MTNLDPNKAELKKAGNLLDTVFKPKIEVRIWVLVILALVANILGAQFHV